MVNQRAMEVRTMASRNPHHSTADLLTWSEIRLPDYSSASNRSNQPSDGMSEVLSGYQITSAEAKSLNKNYSYRKNCSGHKMKEMTGSDIFSDNGKEDPNHQTRIHYHHDQQSQISFSNEDNVTPKKLTTLSSAAKQKELSRSVLTEADSISKKKQNTNAKTKAMNGHDIFASPEIQPRRLLAANRNVEESEQNNAKTKAMNGHDIYASSETQPHRLLATNRNVEESEQNNAKIKAMNGHDIYASSETQPHRLLATTQQEVQGNRNVEETGAPRNSRASKQTGNRLFSEEHVVKSSRKIHNQKVQALTSNGIFNCDKIQPGFSEKMQSSAKKREMKGHNIFANGVSEYRDYYGGARRPPGGESSISLV